MTKNLFDPTGKDDELDPIYTGGEALGDDLAEDGEILEQEILIQDIGSDIRSPQQTRDGRRRHDIFHSRIEERESLVEGDN